MHPYIALVQALPLHQHLGIQVTHAEEGVSRIVLPVGDGNVNVFDMLHGGVVHAVADVAAYVALVSLLGEGENAVTHDLHVQVLRPASRGAVVQFEGRVRRKGKTLAFIDVEATVDGKLIALARLTKSLVAAPSV